MNEFKVGRSLISSSIFTNPRILEEEIIGNRWKELEGE